MSISRFLGASVAVALLATPVMAQTQAAKASPASALSLSSAPARAGAAMNKQNKLEGNSLWIIGAVALVAGVTWAIVDDNNSDDDPVSS